MLIQLASLKGAASPWGTKSKRAANALRMKQGQPFRIRLVCLDGRDRNNVLTDLRDKDADSRADT